MTKSFVVGGFLIGLAVVSPPAQEYGSWHDPVNLGAPVNTGDAGEADPFISRDGLSLYFVSGIRVGSWDIYVAQRGSLDEPWGAPQNLGPTINSPADESGPVLSIDGHRLYFASDRPGGFGGNDIYVSRRFGHDDDFSWSEPENLGEGVNTPYNDIFAVPFEDDGTGVASLYFASARPGGFGDHDIYVSIRQADDTYGPAQHMPELSSPYADRHPNIRRDGLELFLMSNRVGSILNPLGNPSFDLWVSTRESTSDPWSEPVNLGEPINTNRHDGHPALSFDERTLYFFSAQRPGNLGVGCPNAATCYFDLWMATRDKVKNFR